MKITSKQLKRIIIEEFKKEFKESVEGGETMNTPQQRRDIVSTKLQEMLQAMVDAGINPKDLITSTGDKTVDEIDPSEMKKLVEDVEQRLWVLMGGRTAEDEEKRRQVMNKLMPTKFHQNP